MSIILHLRLPLKLIPSLLVVEEVEDQLLLPRERRVVIQYFLLSQLRVEVLVYHMVAVLEVMAEAAEAGQYLPPVLLLVALAHKATREVLVIWMLAGLAPAEAVAALAA
ncbi:MAG: hypothetical protein AAB817_02980 [Patescibacteria group bacterium]